MKNRLTAWSVLLLLMLGAVACNETPPSNRPYVALAQTGDDDEEPTDTTVKRPDGEVFFKNDVCACNNGASVLVSNNCSSFCASTAPNTGGADRLYINFTVGAAIELGPWKTVQGWCDTPIEGETGAGTTSCVLRARAQGESTQSVAVTAIKDGNSFVADISALDDDKTYILTLEQTSSVVHSDSTQIRKLSDGLGSTPVGPVAVQPVTQYTCIKRDALQECQSDGQCTSGVYFYENANRQHFYFIEQNRPDPVATGALAQIFCHNTALYGAQDDSEYPRLEETAGAYALWSSQDVRMMNLSGDARIDINELIEKKLRDMGNTPSSSLNLFFPLSMTPGPVLNEAGNSASGGSNVKLGYFMVSFRDSSNNAKCPTQADYQDVTNPTFQVLGDILQVDTEAVYLARRQAMTNSSGACVPNDWLILKHSELSPRWFYYKNQVAYRPVTPADFKNNKIIFHHPFVPGDADPFLRKPNQRTYTVILPSEANTGTCDSSNTGGQPTTDAVQNSIQPHDKRFGCVPVSGTTTP